MGVPYETFWHLNPVKLNSFVKAFTIRQKMQDENMWQMGIYIQRAVGVSVEHCLGGKMAKSEYFSKPLMSETRGKQERELTEEEKVEAQKEVLLKLQIMGTNFASNDT